MLEDTEMTKICVYEEANQLLKCSKAEPATACSSEFTLINNGIPIAELPVNNNDLERWNELEWN